MAVAPLPTPSYVEWRSSRAENYLIAAAAVDCVHVVDKRFHRLVYASHSAVYGMLKNTLFAFKTVEVFVYEIFKLGVVEVFKVFAGEVFESFYFFDE